MPSPKLVLAGALALSLGSAGTVSAGPWIHVQVSERGEKRLELNLPLGLVEHAFDLTPEKIFPRGRVGWERCGRDTSGAGLKRLWWRLRGGGEIRVGCRGDEATVRVTRRGSRIRVHVQGDDRHERVEIESPAAVLDALLSGLGDALNVRAALRELVELDGEVFRLDGDESRVRVWIDRD
jgi:hypothetical protein